MRFISTTLYAVAAITLTTSCSADRSLPDASAPAIASRAASSGRPVLSAEKRRGLYVSTNSSSTMWGYPYQNSENKPPICTVPWNVAVPYDIAVDGKGNLIEPDDNSQTINIGAGPGMCGRKLATISDPYGYPIDAAKQRRNDRCHRGGYHRSWHPFYSKRYRRLFDCERLLRVVEQAVFV